MTYCVLSGLVFLGVCALGSEALYEGDVCTLRSGQPGICKTAENCSAAQRQLASKNILPTTCGFKDLIIPIVCCPQANDGFSTRLLGTDLTDSNYALTQIKKVCEDYANYNYSAQPLPVSLFDVRGADDDILAVDNNQLEDVLNIFSSSGPEDLLPNRVFGGVNAVDGEFPHMVALGFGVMGNIQWLCGGSLISESFVLTAAHCLVSRGVVVSWARMGCLNMNEMGPHTQQIPVSGWFRHEDYKMGTMYNDIALLKLATKARFDNHVRPACIYHLPVGPEDGGCIATGWGGVNESVASSLSLVKVVLTFQSPTLCNTSFEPIIKNSNRLAKGVSEQTMLCVGETDGKKDTCQGDSGGPIQVTLPIRENMYGIVGVTSFGLAGCGQNHVPGIYTRVSHYIPWIVNIIWPQENPVTTSPQERHIF